MSEEPRNQTDSTPTHRLHLWQFQAVRDLLVIAAIVGIFWVGYVLRAVTVPLLVALLLAYLFEPLVARLCRHPRINRPIAVGGLMSTIGLAIVILLVLTVPLVVRQTDQFVRDFREGRFQTTAERLVDYIPESQREWYERMLHWMSGDVVELDELDELADRDDLDEPSDEPSDDTDQPPGQPDTAPEDDSAAQDAPPTDILPETLLDQELREFLTEDRIRTIIAEEIARQRVQAEVDSGGGAGAGATDWIGIARGGASTVFGIIGRVIEFGLLSFLIPFYFYFFSVWYPNVLKFGDRLIPPDRKQNAYNLLAKMDYAVAGFVRGRILISILMGIGFAIGWGLCGVPYAVVLGLVIGIFCAVPYLGVIGVPLAIGFLVLQQLGMPPEARMAWYWWILGPSIVFTIVQLIESYLLTPVIAGKATNLDPVTILVVVLAGGSIMGVYGMLLAIPVAACGKIMITDILWPRIQDWIEGRRADPLPIDRD